MKIIINSLPKAGTNLLAKLFDLIGFNDGGQLSSGLFLRKDLLSKFRQLLYSDQNGIEIGIDSKVKIRTKYVEKRFKKINDKEYILTHIGYQELFMQLIGKYNFKGILAIRDPRAVLISDIYYIKNNVKHHLHYLFKIKSIEDSIKTLIDGNQDNNIIPFAEKVNLLKGYLESNDFLVIKFEDLVGPKGGGNLDNMKKAISNIFNHINYDKYDKEYIVDNLFGPGRATFRTGQVDSWKTTINSNILKYINENLRESLITFGYAKK